MENKPFLGSVVVGFFVCVRGLHGDVTMRLFVNPNCLRKQKNPKKREFGVPFWVFVPIPLFSPFIFPLTPPEMDNIGKKGGNDGPHD